MDSFKEFQGKSLDEAISEACGYFDAPREKLEIEIVQDSKSGIFGLVGARKAKVRARRVQLRTAVEDILGRKAGLTLQAEGEAEADTAAEKGRPEKRHDDDERDGKGKHAERPDTRPDKREKCEKRDADKEDKAEKHERHDKSCARPEKTERYADKGRRERDQKEREPRDPDEQSSVAEAAGLAAESAVGEKPAERVDRSERAARPDRAERADRPEKAERRDRSERPDRSERQDRERRKPAPKAGARRSERPDDRQGERRHDGRPRSAAPARPRQDDGSFPSDAFSEEVLHEDGDDLQRIPFEQLDQDKLRSLSLEVVAKLVSPIVGELPLTVELQEGRVNVRMDCGDDSGLLIGREGQTLASLQYLASRMVSRGMSAAVRVQLDAGEYRLRQDEKLREMALNLAEKVRATGKSHSTRPLSSYHRRIVHLVLQDSADVQTRSSGDGPLKRVVVQRKRS